MAVELDPGVAEEITSDGVPVMKFGVPVDRRHLEACGWQAERRTGIMQMKSNNDLFMISPYV
jgi:hypothetical protein